MIEDNDVGELEQYLWSLRGKGFTIQDYPTYSGNTPALMVCFTLKVTPDLMLSRNNVTAPFMSQINHVMGMPVIESKLFSIYQKDSIVNFTLMDESKARSDSSNTVERLEVSSLDEVSISQAENEVPEVGLPMDFLRQFPFSLPTSNQGGKPLTPIFLNKMRNLDAGWTSLQFSHVETSAEVVSFVMNMIPKEQRLGFIQEVDQLGWTSLHWAAYKDDSDAIDSAFSSLTLEEQATMANVRSKDKRGWTLLQSAAIKDSVSTMKTLMNKFPRDVKWNILSCCTQKQGATALHIAVAERSVKAVILLLDAAEERRDDLLNLTDRNKKSAVDYTSEFSLLGKYLRLSSTDINPGTAVYKAVVADDLMMVQFIYEHSMKPFAIDFIKNNANGRNLIQEAMVGI